MGGEGREIEEGREGERGRGGVGGKERGGMGGEGRESSFSRFIIAGGGTYFLTVVAWNAALSPSDPVCSDGVTIDMIPPVFGGVVIPGGVVTRGLVRDVDGNVWLIDGDRSRELVRGGREDLVCTNRATLLATLSEYPIRTMAG